MTSVRKTGRERFSFAGQHLEADLLAFWQWSVSLLSNASRGRLAEYIVALALDVPCEVRAEWDAYDLETRDGIKVEVKSAAYVQSWAQPRPSRISFGCQCTALLGDTAESRRVSQRRSDVYVFSLLQESERSRVNPMALEQWEFYVVSTLLMNERFPAQKSISLAVVRSLASAVSFIDLAAKVRACNVQPLRSMLR